jgi:hypothetical protein
MKDLFKAAIIFIVVGLIASAILVLYAIILGI